MKQKIAFLGVWFALSSLVFGQTVPLNVQKTAGTNAITGDLVIGAGRALSATGGGTIGATSVTYATSVTETSGTGTPEGVVTANIGSVFHRTNGSTGTTLYIKESGTGNTGWVAIAAATGTVNSGTANQIGYYATTSSAISGSTGLTWNGSTDVTLNGTTYASFNANAATGNNPQFLLQINGTGLAVFAVASATNSIVTGSAANDAVFRTPGGSFLWTTDTGSTIALKVNGSGQVSAEKTTASTSTTTGALISKGGLGVAGAAYIGGNLVPAQTNGIVGTTTNNDANAGSFGEYVHSEIAVGSAVSLTTATGTNITSISLTAGDWEVSGNVNFSAASATVTGTSGGISSTSATVPTDGTEVYSGVQVTLLSETDSVTLPSKRFSLSGTTTVYLIGKSTFSAGTVAGFGAIKARRVR